MDTMCMWEGPWANQETTEDMNKWFFFENFNKRFRSFNKAKIKIVYSAKKSRKTFLSWVNLPSVYFFSLQLY